MAFSNGDRVYAGCGPATVTGVIIDQFGDMRIRVVFDSWELAKTLGEPYLSVYAVKYLDPARDPQRYRNVIYNYCSECDEEGMIFYSEDYLCAWCREHLEDEVR